MYLGCNGSYSRRLQKRKEVLQKVYYRTYKPWSRLVAQNKHLMNSEKVTKRKTVLTLQNVNLKRCKIWDP